MRTLTLAVALLAGCSPMTSGLPILGIRGVKSYANEFADLPLGALTVGDNIEINRMGIAEPRRGFPPVGGSFVGGHPTTPARKLYWWNGYVLANYYSQMEYFDGSAWNLLGGTYLQPSTGYRTQGVVANQSLYITTAAGVQVMDSLTNGFVPAGVPRALDIALASAGAGTAVNAGSQAAYRFVWGKRDANGYLKLGAPSQRQVIINSGGGAINVTVTVRLQAAITSSYFLQVYRTASSVDANTDPGDTMQLVYEYPLANTDVAAGTVTFTDVTPDSLRGAALYTNPDQPNGTIAASRLPPPMARTMAWFKNSMFYGYCRQPARLQLALLSNTFASGEYLELTEAPSGATLGITNGTDFSPSNGGTAAQNIDGTARAMVKGWNTKYASRIGSGFLASYLSGPDDVPGKMLFESIDFPDATYPYEYIGAVAKFSPSLPTTDATASNLTRTSNVVTVNTVGSNSLVVGQTFYLYNGVNDANFPSGVKTIATVNSPTQFTYNETGSNATATGQMQIAFRGSVDTTIASTFLPNYAKLLADDQKNIIYWSEPGMPDSVPLRNSMKLGADDKAVIALVPLRDSLMVFKEDGLFKVTGSGGVFSWEQVDTTIRLLGPELAASLENQVFALTDQGVVAIPEQGAPKVVGYDIQDKLPTTTSSSVSWFGFVVAQESRREFRVAVMSSDQFYSTIPNEQWVYNTFTDSWTHHLIYATAGLVTPTSDPTYPDYLYLADGLVNQVRREVKSSSDFYNHYDNTFGGSISSSGGNTVTIAAAPTAWALAVGDAIEQGSNRSTITAINGLVLTVADTLAWSGGACTLYGGFESDIQWTPFAQPNPCMLKQFPEVSATFRQAAFSTATLSFWTDLMPNANAVAMAGPGPIGGTLGPWLMRAWVPQDDQMASQLNVKLSIRNALGSWQLQGLNVSSSPFSMAAHK